MTAILYRENRVSPRAYFYWLTPNRREYYGWKLFNWKRRTITYATRVPGLAASMLHMSVCFFGFGASFGWPLWVYSFYGLAEFQINEIIDDVNREKRKPL